MARVWCTRTTYHCSFLNAAVQLCPMHIIRGHQLTDGHMPPVSAGEARVGMSVCRRVVHEILKCLLGRGWMSRRARGRRRRMSLVLREALAMRSDMSGPVPARLRAGSRSESWRRGVRRWTGETGLGRTLGSGISCLHGGRLAGRISKETDNPRFDRKATSAITARRIGLSGKVGWQ